MRSRGQRRGRFAGAGEGATDAKDALCPGVSCWDIAERAYATAVTGAIHGLFRAPLPIAFLSQAQAPALS